MPEMLEFCGRKFRVSNRALTICFSGPGSHRRFEDDDVVTLDGVRCSGAAHDGCQKACMIFWREAWLRKVEGTANQSNQSQLDLRGMDRLLARLKVSTGPKKYYCQASELLKATHPTLALGKIEKILDGTPRRQLQRSANGAELWNMAVLENTPDVSRRISARKQRVHADGSAEPPAWRMGRSEIDAEHHRDLERARA